MWPFSRKAASMNYSVTVTASEEIATPNHGKPWSETDSRSLWGAYQRSGGIKVLPREAERLGRTKYAVACRIIERLQRGRDELITQRREAQLCATQRLRNLGEALKERDEARIQRDNVIGSLDGYKARLREMKADLEELRAETEKESAVRDALRRISNAMPSVYEATEALRDLSRLLEVPSDEPRAFKVGDRVRITDTSVLELYDATGTISEVPSGGEARYVLKLDGWGCTLRKEADLELL